MSQLNRGPIRILAVAAAASLLLAACGSSNPTPIVVVETPTPTPEVTTAPTPEATPTVTVTATPAVTPAPTPTPSQTPLPTSTSAAALCSGSAANQAFFVEAAHGVKATTYCATKLAGGWTISAGNWQGTKNGGWMVATYKYGKTNQTFEIKEGAFCLTDVATCAGGMQAIVQTGVHFGGMTAYLSSYGTPGMYLMQLNPGKSNAYFLTTHNITQAAAVAIGANMKAVPKS